MSKRSRWADFSDEIRSAAAEEPAEQRARQENDVRALFTGRLRFLIVGFAFFLLVATVRLVTWQIFGRSAEADSPAPKVTDSSRGRILDRNGLLLATDTFTWDIVANPEDYRRANVPPEQIDAYAAKIGIAPLTLRNGLAQEGKAVLIARDVTQEQCNTADNDRAIPPWIWCDGRRLRLFPHNTQAAHVLGFVDRDQVGQAGVEAVYNRWLRTVGDWPAQQLPGSPRPLPEAWLTYLPSPGGRDLVLNLNAALQYTAETILAEAVQRYEAKSGVILVQEPNTGAILALAHMPTYDPNHYAQAEKEAWLNTAVSDHYEPGSVMKLITYAAALDAGLATPETIYEDTGELELSGRKITNSQERAAGMVTVQEALAQSLNVVAAQICLDMGADTFYRYLRQFGFGKVTEADLGLESPGIVKRPGTTLWSRFDQAANAFGQGISVTPLQMINAVAAIANGGNLMQPQMVQSLVYNGQMYRVPPRRLGQAIKRETALAMARMMVYTVDSYATGPDLVPGVRVAGKTGTAEIPKEGGYTSDLTITTFVGFLPAANPKIVILVKLDEPKTSRWAEQVALPVFGELARQAIHILKIQPDDRMP